MPAFPIDFMLRLIEQNKSLGYPGTTRTLQQKCLVAIVLTYRMSPHKEKFWACQVSEFSRRKWSLIPVCTRMFIDSEDFKPCPAERKAKQKSKCQGSKHLCSEERLDCEPEGEPGEIIQLCMEQREKRERTFSFSPTTSPGEWQEVQLGSARWSELLEDVVMLSCKNGFERNNIHSCTG